MIIAFDFDGTLVKEKYPEIGPLYPGVTSLLQRLKRCGCKLVLYTMRSGKLLDEAVNFMRANGVEFDGINCNPYQDKWKGEKPSNKVYADIYIDDHNLGIPKFYDGSLDWESISNMLIAEVYSRIYAITYGTRPTAVPVFFTPEEAAFIRKQAAERGKKTNKYLFGLALSNDSNGGNNEGKNS